MKRFLSFILALTLAVSLLPSAFAASDEAVQAANALHTLGLFNGTGTDANGNPVYDLERTPTRAEAVTMLVRLLGKEEEAEKNVWTTPFTDVADWAKPYVGYAYNNGLTSGISATIFGTNNDVTASQYITFALRALGYESGKDFKWDSSWKLADSIGLTNGEYTNNTCKFTRGEAAFISLLTLTCNLKNSDEPLFSKIQESGDIGENVSFSAPRKLKYTYCNDQGDAMNYENEYIKDATVARIGELYLFKFTLIPKYFLGAYFFPSGYQGDIAGYSKKISIFSSKNADISTFLVTNEFIYRNPINQTSMVFDLRPNLTSFPENFKFAEGCIDKCIIVDIKTADLPK